jgi:hypothetical protein
MPYPSCAAAPTAVVRIPRAQALLLTFLTALVCVPPVAAAELKWPPGELSAHVQAYFAQLQRAASGGPRFFTEHMSPAAPR